jgi:hypothetical protein
LGAGQSDEDIDFFKGCAQYLRMGPSVIRAGQMALMLLARVLQMKWKRKEQGTVRRQHEKNLFFNLSDGSVGIRAMPGECGAF